MGCIITRRRRAVIAPRDNLNTEESFFISKRVLEVVITHGGYPGYEDMACLAEERIKAKFEKSKITRVIDYSRESKFEIKARLPSTRVYRVIHCDEKGDPYVRPSTIPRLLSRLSNITGEQVN